MNEPIIKWSPIQFRIQPPYKCVSYAICNLLEKLFQIKGQNVTFNPDDLDFKIRTDQKDFEGGVSLSRGLSYVSRNGIEGFRIKGTTIHDLGEARDLLLASPVILSRKSYQKVKKRFQDGYYILSEPIQGQTHAVVIIGYEDGYIVWDSKYKFTYKLRDDDYKLAAVALYSINL